MASVVSLPERSLGQAGWSNQELAELYRAAENLTQAGLPVGAESGVTDEGHPWYIFYREDVQEVIVHFARVDGMFIAASAATDDVVHGQSFRSVIHQLLRRQPFVLPMPARAGGDLFLHPSVVLTAFIATAYMMSTGEAGQTAEDEADGAEALSDAESVSDAESGRAPSFRNEVAARLEALAAKIAGLGRSPTAQQDAATNSAIELSTVQTAAMASVLAVATASLQRDGVDGQVAAEDDLAQNEAGRTEAEQGASGAIPFASGQQNADGSPVESQVVVSQDVAAQVTGQNETLAAHAEGPDGAGAPKQASPVHPIEAVTDGHLSSDLLSELYGAEIAEVMIDSQDPAGASASEEELASRASDGDGLSHPEEAATEASEGDELAAAPQETADQPDSQADGALELSAADAAPMESFGAADEWSLGDGLGSLSGLLETTVSFLSEPLDGLDDEAEPSFEAAGLAGLEAHETGPLAESASAEDRVLILDATQGEVIYEGGHVEVVGFQRGLDTLVVRDLVYNPTDVTYEVTDAGDVIFTLTSNDTLTFIGLLSDYGGATVA